MKSLLTDVQLKGEHGTCPVVRIKADNAEGFTEINEHSFDSAVHEKYVPKAEKKVAVTDWSKESKEAISKHLASLGIEHDQDALKKDLLALLP